MKSGQGGATPRIPTLERVRQEPQEFETPEFQTKMSNAYRV